MRETPAAVYRADARGPGAALAPCSVDAVITSPPYPTEKDYTRSTRLESVLLGFLGGRQELRAPKQGWCAQTPRSLRASAGPFSHMTMPTPMRLSPAIQPGWSE